MKKIAEAYSIAAGGMLFFAAFLSLGYALCPETMQGGAAYAPTAAPGRIFVWIGSLGWDHPGIVLSICLGLGLTEEFHVSASLLSFLSYEVLAHGISRFMPFSTARNDIPYALLGMIAAFLACSLFQRVLKKSCDFWKKLLKAALLTIIGSLISAALFSVLWPFVYAGITALGRFCADGSVRGAFWFHVSERLLAPFGMERGLNRMVWNAETGLGDLSYFWARRTSEEVSWPLGLYMSGFFPIMMGGIPAACAVHRKHDGNRRWGMIGLVSFLGGTALPYEYLLLVHPLLYVGYCVSYGISAVLADLVSFRAGLALSGGFADFFFSGVMPASKNPQMVIVLGAAAAGCYALIAFLRTRKK
ncbi:MAG: PTS transporter subunit EIIC [Bulleidia sp.]